MAGEDPVRQGDSLAGENEVQAGLHAAQTDFECEDRVCSVVQPPGPGFFSAGLRRTGVVMRCVLLFEVFSQRHQWPALARSRQFASELASATSRRIRHFALRRVGNIAQDGQATRRSSLLVGHHHFSASIILSP